MIALARKGALIYMRESTQEVAFDQGANKPAEKVITTYKAACLKQLLLKTAEDNTS